jgi:sporulation protein YlmC with PRC-barrel domain
MENRKLYLRFLIIVAWGIKLTIEVGCLKEKNVITKDGKMIGTLIGADIETASWSVPTIRIEVDKDIIRELGLEKSMMKSTKIKLSTGLIELVGDIVQLSVNLKSLREAL